MNKTKTDETVEAIRTLTQERNGLPPTIREVQAHLGLKSSSTAAYRIRQLKEQGLVTTEGGSLTRTIRVVKDVT